MMISSAFDVLGVGANDGDETIRKAYLTLVKENPPERDQRRFQDIRDAYEKIETHEKRIAYVLFEFPVIGMTAWLEAYFQPGEIKNIEATLLKNVITEAMANDNK